MTTMAKKNAPMERHTTIAGEVLEYPHPDAELARFLARVRTAAEDPRVSEHELVDLIYGSENPLLDHTIFKGRGAVTLKAFENPVYHVMLDLLDAKRVQVGTLVPERAGARYTMPVADAAAELGITPSAVRQAVERGQLAAWKANARMLLLDPQSVRTYREHVTRRGPRPSPALSLRMGNKPGLSFRVKAPNLELIREEPLEGGGKAIDGVVHSFTRAAIAMSWTTRGEKKNVMLVIAPAEAPYEVKREDFDVTGNFRIVEKVNDPEEASKRFRTFRAE